MLKKIIRTPFQKFVKTESLGGILLFGATIIALIWANSSFVQQYESLWQYKIGFSFQDFELEKPLILWINDGLMAIFFFLIGLELKREFLIGELNTIKKAAFPFFAALGGVIVPIALFFILNKNPETARGWGIPMATDIAFALAILKLLGNRVPLSIKVFLTAFAIIDDIGAVLVIAIFYSTAINWMLLIYALLLISILAFLSYKKIYINYVFLVFGVIVWILFLKSGIHPTIAGVLLAFTIPIRQKINIKEYANQLTHILGNIKSDSNNQNNILSKNQITQIEDLKTCTEKVKSPLQDLENTLHSFVAYFIMPVFALSNAGVIINTSMKLDYSLIFNIAIGLFVGKLVGVSLLSYIGTKLKIIALPTGVNFKQIIGVAILAGVGFTMSIFIANLAFVTSPSYIDSAKIGILLGSLISGLIGYTILKLTNKNLKIINKTLV
ncbi:Na+/H+ antiporter NhaA [Lutibacter sp.]|uniref:Na+/H+ antiporter NhaA n=1 Tax=Lutibacter sp. TaxID=1925666 RepID=UPI0025B810DD|nr:Na+/H+ antiporter NhaA [Lutibacter sp.]MCF6182845.1 Na+/H+ antiporter NhaA [Lutibacter sp.]